MNKHTETWNCHRCNRPGEPTHMVPILGNLMHPLCAVALIGEDGLCRLPYGYVKNIRRSDVGDRIIRKLLEAH